MAVAVADAENDGGGRNRHSQTGRRWRLQL